MSAAARADFCAGCEAAAAKVSEVASANVQLHGQNSNESEPRPLPEVKTSEELFARVLQSGLYAIKTETGNGITSH